MNQDDPKTQERLSAAIAAAMGDAPHDLLKGFDPEDVGNGQRLIKKFGKRLRYVHAFNSWLVWNRRQWKRDATDQARALMQRTLREFGRQAFKAGIEHKQKFASKSRRSARITNAMREARPHLVVTPDELDRDPYLLNFLNGTVDLRTGVLAPHNPNHYITKLIHYKYTPGAPCPTFLSFLYRAMGARPDASESELDQVNRMVDYLQRAFGYSLTGVTSEKAVFLLHGTGDNGKSTLLSLFLELLGDYAVLLMIDTLMAPPRTGVSSNNQADLADLFGARFVMTSETQEGQRLNEAQIKRITQGMGRIKVCRKYENPFEFEETHKLWIDGNHLPVIRGTDNAIWNRLHPVPFAVTIPPKEQDKQLRRKMLGEAEGILAWQVGGAVRWYKEGLGRPPEVEVARASWRAESDQIGRFIEERCVVSPNARVKARSLYEAYKRWAEDVGEHAETETAFGLRVTAREGVNKVRDENGNVYIGIGLVADTAGTC